MRRKYQSLLGALALTVASGCGGGNGSPAVYQNSVVVRSTTKILPRDGSAVITKLDGSHLKIIGTGVPTINVGDVIVSAAGEGALYKATSVAPTSGGVTVGVQAANLADALQKMNTHLTVPISQDHTKSITTGSGVTASWITKSAGRASGKSLLHFDVPLYTLYDRDGNSSTKNDQLNLVATVDINPSGFFNVDADWSLLGPSLQKVEAGLNLDAGVDVNLQRGKDLGGDLGDILKVEKKGDISLGTVELEPIIFDVGVLPVVISQTVSFSLHYELTLDADLNPHLTTSVSGRIGAGYSGGNGYVIQELSSSGLDFNFKFGQINGSSRVDLPLITYQAKLYGLVGPEISAGPYFQGDLTAVLLPPSMDISASLGAEGTVGFHTTILGEKLDYSHTLADVKFWSKTYHRDVNSSADVTIKSVKGKN